MARVFEGERTFLHPLLRPLERLIYRLCGIRETSEQRWTQYAASVIAFSLVSFLFVYAIQRLQGFLPINPMGFSTAHAPPTPRHDAGPGVQYRREFHDQHQLAVLRREQTLSYFVQMAALTVQNFVSAAAGIAVAIALIRGFARRQANTIGNFWVDLTRATVYVLLPLAFLFALFLCVRGVPNFKAYQTATTLEGATQTIAVGPVAGQEAIKMLGTNGGGFFNANSSHPYENPTPLTNFLELLSILVISSALTYTFGRMVGDTRQGWALFAAMAVMFLAGVFICYHAERRGNPNLARLGIEAAASLNAIGRQSGGQGSSVRKCEFSPLGGGNNRRQQRQC